MRKSRGLSLGKIGACWLVHVLGVHLEKEAVVFEDTLVLLMPVMELHVEWNQLEGEATLYCTLVATSESSPLLNSKFSHRFFWNMCCAMGVHFPIFGDLDMILASSEGGYSDFRNPVLPGCTGRGRYRSTVRVTLVSLDVHFWPWHSCWWGIYLVYNVVPNWFLM